MRTGGSNCNCESQNGGKCKRKLTAYNKFMKTEIQKEQKSPGRYMEIFFKYDKT